MEGACHSSNTGRAEHARAATKEVFFSTLSYRRNEILNPQGRTDWGGLKDRTQRWALRNCWMRGRVCVQIDMCHRTALALDRFMHPQDGLLV